VSKGETNADESPEQEEAYLEGEEVAQQGKKDIPDPPRDVPVFEEGQLLWESWPHSVCHVYRGFLQGSHQVAQRLEAVSGKELCIAE